MTVPKSASGRFGEGEVDDMPEQQGTNLFFRKKLALAIVTFAIIASGFKACGFW